ncbi:MAG TPA: hypothetical protein VJ974_06810 [Geopsychrobacteraceae bacterium]|nr:hypothetical protein [Geopsychrobacteraceae bacterium]
MANGERKLLNPEQVANLKQALTANQEELFQLLLSTDLEMVGVLLKNPHLTEDHILTLLKRRDLSDTLLKRIYQRYSKNLSHRLILALVKNPNTPGAIMRNLLPHLRLFELVDLCFLPGITPDQKMAAERGILLRLPVTPLGSKMTLARRATAAVVGELLKEGHSTLVEICLNSPRITEASVFQFINSPKANAATLSLIARNSRWKSRPNLQLAILKNRKTPPVWFTLWVPRLAVHTANQLLANRRLTATQKRAIQDAMSRRKKF